MKSRGWRAGLAPISCLIAVTAGLIMVPAYVSADDRTDVQQRVNDATQVLRELVRADDADGIPAALLDRAKAIAVVPHVVRGAFVVGGRWGKGVLVTRGTDGSWGPASFLDLSGASVGFQIGADATDLVMVFIEEDGVEALLGDRIELGANVSAAAGPLGRSAEVGTNVTLDSAIYAYSRSKGAFAGAALDGTVITIDDSANETAYGRKLDGDTVLGGEIVSAPVFAPFVAAVAEVTPEAAG